jgi:pimeloyl-ACP methyl ester carboxylesterase
MYYEMSGEGELIVLIAGLGTDITPYRRNIRALSEEHKVFAFDNRGVGRTDKPDVPYTIEIMADDTAGLLRALGIARASVLGISMGGRIALALALRHPELVKSLVLTSTSARNAGSPRFPYRYMVVKMLRSTGMTGRSRRQPYYAFLRQLAASRGFDCTDSLDRITVPTLILHGRTDKLVPYDLAKEMNAGIKGSRMVTFKGGHRFFFWEIERYTEAVSEFLKGLN